MEKIPTAEELLNEILSCLKIEREALDNDPELKPYLLEQINNRTKLHVKAALETAAQNAKHVHSAYDSDFKINKQSILDSYSEDLIK